MAARDSGVGGCYVCGEPSTVTVSHPKSQRHPGAVPYRLSFCALCYRNTDEYRAMNAELTFSAEL